MTRRRTLRINPADAERIQAVLPKQKYYADLAEVRAEDGVYTLLGYRRELLETLAQVGLQPYSRFPVAALQPIVDAGKSVGMPLLGI